jgi:hypothetical protein
MKSLMSNLLVHHEWTKEVDNPNPQKNGEFSVHRFPTTMLVGHTVIDHAAIAQRRAKIQKWEIRPDAPLGERLGPAAQ